jgi:predicted ABC-type transport system involved in lysophospholipase L1 biosynthesis ATPase subunit
LQVSDSTLQALGGGAKQPAQFGHDALVACDNLVRIFQSGSVEVQALQGLDLLVDEGEMVAVVGASGSGK